MADLQINMHEAKSRLSELGERVWKGERVVIAKAGKPYLDLLPHTADPVERKPGRMKGEIALSDDFDQTPEDVVQGFEGTDETPADP
ncbi:MAG: type II toxin-antitoxin system prevent-host-death family antitoxin [Pseudohongiellaceae bacterium]